MLVDQQSRLLGRSDERRWAILQEVQQRGRIRVAELSRQLGLSEVAIRRHLRQLEEAGLLRRVHGGAQALTPGGHSSVFEARLLQNGAVKQALGRAAAALIDPGASVFLDSGTTILEVARQLSTLAAEGGAGLTVLTRSLAIAAEIRTQRRIRLIVVGGVYVHDFDDFVGPQVSQTLQEVHADILFIGTDGVDGERGFTTDNVLEANLYKDIARCAERVVVVTDSSKVGVTKVQTTLAFSDIHTFVTDNAAPPEFLEMLRERGIEVIAILRP